ncbi:dockerin type I repeat-containing protein [Ruminococcus flavefaciens]|uniref:dockerin type I repeat-containing protein n=1 Tax=Ruminococcus flavefaciens TaxID=1265 RepID=UPI000465BE80|nr:dockerin type I repeat-containing protein [Ruminococcus flavefaciens]
MNKRKILTLLTALTMSMTSMAFTPAYAVAESDTAAAVSEENSGIHFNVKNDCISVELGLNTAVSISGYDDGKQYEVGESPIKFTVDDESVAKVTQVQGKLVNIKGVSMGVTVLRAETPDGKKASVRVAIIEIPPALTSTALTNTTTVTTTATATHVTTSTVIYDYAPTVEFDKSAMKVGEVREGRFYNPETKKNEGGWVEAGTDNISVEYTEGSDIFTVRALEAGEAKLGCWTKGCAFTNYVYFDVVDDEVLPDFAPTVEFDNSDMKVGETREGRFYNPVSGRSTGGNIKASDNVLVTLEKDGHFSVTAVKAGSVSMEITDNGCPFVGHVAFTVKDADTTTTAVTMTTTQLTTSTVHIDYMTKVEFDNTPLNVGEVRKIKFGHPNGETEGGSVYSSSELIEVSYEKGTNSFEVKALKEGEASISVHARGCAFDPTVTIKVVSASKLKGDANCDNGTDMADVVYVMQSLANPDKYKLSTCGKDNADLNGDGVTVGDAQKIQLKLLGLDDDSEPLTPLAQAVGVDTTDEAIKLIRSYDLNDYNVNARETMKQMFESFKKDGFIYRFAEVTGDDAVKLRDDYVNPPVWLGPYANFEDIGILYHVKAYDMNYQLYYFNRGNDYAGQSMAGYIKNRFGFNVTKVIDDKYFIFDSSKDGQNDISVIFALDDGHYCKVRCFGSEAELMKLAKSLKSVKLPLGEKKITDLNDVNALLIAYETEHKLPVSMITSISQGDKQVYVYLGTFDIKEQEKVIEQMKNYMKFMNIDEELVCFAIPQTIAE